MKGMRDKDGNPLPNAHLQGLFSRVCKLLFYRIKPVFVFDGGVPVLKKKTLAARRDRREEAERESSAVAEKLLENLVKSHAVKQVLGGEGQRSSGPSSSSRSKPTRVPGVRKGRNQKLEDIFELAPLPESEEINLIKEAQQWEQDFERQENWIKDSEDFSSFQLKRLMKNCRLTTRMVEIQKEMTNQTALDITAQYAGEECGAVKNQFGDQVEARRIVSEDASHYVLIKGISSDGQVEQADRYHLEQTVKVEDVDSDEDVKPDGPSEGRCSSPEKSRKPSVKIVSTDDSDSDIEAVVARRMRRKGRSKAWSAKRNKQGLERGKIAAALTVKEEKAQPKQTKKRKPVVVETSSSSEDEGFIEVTVDADMPMEEDELFPASIFETPGENFDERGLNLSNSEALGDKAKGKPQESFALRGREKGKKQKVVQETPGEKHMAESLSKDTEEIDIIRGAKSPSVVETGRSKSDMLGKSNTSRKEVLESISKQLKEKRKEVGEVEAVAAKRKNILTDILGQLKEKKKKLQEEEVEITKEDNCSSKETSEEERGEKFTSFNTIKATSHQTDEEVSATGGGFIPEESSDEDVLDDSKQGKQQVKVSVVSEVKASAENLLSHETSRCEHSTSLDSDSDEDLKLAKQLSLQTGDNDKQSLNKDSELDEDLKLAIRMSLEVSKPGGEKAAAHGKETEENRSKGENLQRRSSNLSKISSISEDESERFEDVEKVEEEVHEVTKTGTREAKERSESWTTGLQEEGIDPDHGRLQPEDFEVDDSDSRAFVPALTEHDLHDMRDELENERSALILQQGQRNRMATSVTEQTNLDAQDLLRLFGIPFIVSPLEAEAQCAFLEAAGLTEGTITDDSDFWLFGGQRLYKNFFNQSKHVELYTMDNIHNHFSLSREQLINIALLCGSDYTEGLQGVGPVRALEIMAEFPGTGLEGLYKFRQWWDKAKKTPGSLIVENKIRARLRNLTLISGFPSEAVVEAYMNPTVDESTERFSWAGPDLDLLREYPCL
ncbi:DNA repair protein complementing XP-G cells-like protein [Elysia marginata]|uniref:DNA repair protein complementing XP-G cells-like protein n=1 Tax=Elysia marginata TaxID=1093978 RepID=A0AAV4J6I7_9GAST|nr:DNA repair protein complementing XP-G cells-like protein [Elysia marginata]